jgi:type II secretory pathway predicted ATPase ExeA
MTYLAHFGLREHPFFLSPTTDHFFPTTHSLQLLQLLEQAIVRNGGLIKLVGPISSGKTLTAHLLAQRLMQRSERPAEVAVITAPKTQGAALIVSVCKAFGLELSGSQVKPLDVLGTFLVEQKAAGNVCVLIIDDAQTMGLAGLETAQLLSELENDHGRLMHVVLVGQSALDAMLAAKPMQKVRQAIAFSFSTIPFSPVESRDFIARRLASSREGGATRDIFDGKAIELIVQVTAGVPGSLIVLCDKALRVAQEQGYRTVTRAHVQAATLDCPDLAPVVPHKSHGGAWPWIAGIAGVAIGAVVAGGVLISPETRAFLHEMVTGQPAVVADATPTAAEREATATKAAAAEAEAEKVEAAKPAAVPAPTHEQQQEVEIDAQPRLETPTASASPPAATLPPVETQPTPTVALENRNTPENSVEVQAAPMTSVTEPTTPIAPPTVAPPTVAADAAAKAATAPKPVAKPAVSKPVEAAVTPAPAEKKAASAKKAPTAAKPTPTSAPAAKQAPTKPSPTPEAPTKTRQAHIGPDGKWVWE